MNRHVPYTMVFVVMVIVSSISIVDVSDDKTLNSTSNPVEPIFQVRREIVGSSISGSNWIITKDTIAENMTIEVDYIQLNNHTTLTLKNCTLMPLSAEDIYINTNNYTHLYIEDSNVSHVTFNSIILVGYYLYMNLNVSIENSTIDNMTIDNSYSLNIGTKWFMNLFISKSIIYDSYIVDKDSTRNMEHHNISITESYLYGTHLSIIYKYKGNQYNVIIEKSVFDNSEYIPNDVITSYNYDDILNDFYNLDDDSILYINTPYHGASISDISIGNYIGIFLGNTSIYNSMIQNVGILIFTGQMKGTYIKSIYAPIFVNSYHIFYGYKIQTVTIQDSVIDTSIYIGSHLPYWLLIPNTISIKNTSVNDIYTIRNQYIDTTYYDINSYTTVALDNVQSNTVSIIANESINLDYENPRNPIVNVSITNSNIKSLFIDNITDCQIEDTDITDYAIFKNSNVTMYSTNYNAIAFYNSSIEVYYRLSVTIYTDQNVLTKIYNNTNAKVYSTEAKEFSIKLISFTINRTDYIRKFYPYQLKSITISDEAETTIDNFTRDEYLVIHIGLYKIKASAPNNKTSGWVLVPLLIDEPYSAMELLKSSEYFRALIYEIGGNDVLLYKRSSSQIYGNDFTLRPFSSVYIYISVSSVETILPLNFGDFTETTISIHYGINYIAIPTTLTLNYFFAQNPYIIEVSIVSEDGIQVYSKYDASLETVIIKPTDGLIVYSTADNKHITL